MRLSDSGSVYDNQIWEVIEFLINKSHIFNEY